MTDRVMLEVINHIAVVRLNRPEKRNALDGAMFKGIASTIQKLGTMPDVRAVVLTAEGPDFCSGIDLGAFSEDGDLAQDLTDLISRSHGIANLFQFAAWGWRELPMPCITALRGKAFGGGLQVALGADIRIAAPNAQMSVMEINWGLVPDMAGVALMRQLAREDVVRELTFTGRVLDAEAALNAGFITRLADDPEGEAMETARQIADRSPQAMRAVKRLMSLAYRDVSAPILIAESQEQCRLLGSPDQREAVAARIEGRNAIFQT